jgi:3-oxoacyl-[acyl-carrier-protein] synthase-3
VAGIVGKIGVFLPEEVRRNDWWSAEIVERWKTSPPTDNPVVATQEGRVMEALRALASDPFAGSVERRVMPDSMLASDMEIAAAQQALTWAGIDKQDVGLLLVSSCMPDLIGTNPACTVHAGLGLPAACISLLTESSFNGFAHQVELAAAMIDTGRVRFAVLVQSSSMSRFLPYDEPYAPWSGDGATAFVMGPVAKGFGVLGTEHGTDGSLQGGLLIGHRGARWFDRGYPVLYSDQPELQRRTLMLMERCAAESINTALASAGLTAADVDVYACHQSVIWFRQVTAAAAGIEHARSLDTFKTTASLGAGNIPVVLAAECEQGLLRDGDIVVTHSGGAGGTWSSVVMRWGSGAA